MIVLLIDIWNRPGQPVQYCGLRQTDNTCVYVSVAGAVNWLTGANLTEASMNEAVRRLSIPGPSFGYALRCLPTAIQIESQEYHDKDNPSPGSAIIIEQVRMGGVLVLSLALAKMIGNIAVPCGGHHNIAVFNSAEGQAQVWDTNGKTGYMTWDEAIELLGGNSLAIPFDFPGGKVLISHDQHHCLLLTKAEVVRTMNKTTIEKNADGTYKVTLPTGGGAPALNDQDVVTILKDEEAKLQKALDDVKAAREKFQKKS